MRHLPIATYTANPADKGRTHEDPDAAECEALRPHAIGARPDDRRDGAGEGSWLRPMKPGQSRRRNRPRTPR